MSIRTVEFLYQKLSKCSCSSCCSNCPGKLLFSYMKKVGIQEFLRQYESDELPTTIRETFNKKVKALEV